MSNDGAECWDDAATAVTACERCPALVDSRSQIVNGVGPTDADLLFVGEAPGANEDEQGEPFVGRSGDVLDEGLRDVGLARQDVRITNCVRCRPPENRDPTTDERANCRGFLDSEILTVDPELVVTLGKVPAELLLDRSVAVTSEAGTIDELLVDGTAWQVLVCVHPAATLYDPSQQDAFDTALQTAVEYAGDGGQSTFEAF
jgi:DNA polymerase